jgi:hypothetical protein
MQTKPYPPGGTLRLPPDTRLVFHRRQGHRIVLGAFATPGTDLILGGARITPITGTPGLWSYLFSLHTVRNFILGEHDIHVWLPGELPLQAGHSENWLHIGVVGPQFEHCAGSPIDLNPNVSPPASAPPALPLVRAASGCRPVLMSAKRC